MPDFTKLYRFLKRLEENKAHQAVGETVRRLGGVHRRRAQIAVDKIGLTQGAFSSYFARRMQHFHEARLLPWRHWLKWLLVVDLDQQVDLPPLKQSSW